MAAVFEEVVRQGRRLAIRQAVEGEDGEVSVERDHQRIEGVVYFSRRGDAAKLDCTVLEIDHVPLSLENTSRVELVELSGRELMVQNRSEGLAIDVVEERGEVCGLLGRGRMVNEGSRRRSAR